MDEYMTADHDGCLCNLSVRNGLYNEPKYVEGICTNEALDMMNEYRRDAMLYAARHDNVDKVVYGIIEHDEMLDIITHVHYFVGTPVSDEELMELSKCLPCTEFRVLYLDHCRGLCKNILAEEKSKHIEPITLKEANAFVVKNHRHHDSVQGCKFAIGLFKTVKGVKHLIGVAICGRPVSRYLDDGLTLEINRLCTTEKGNCCSMLYGRCVKIAKEMGYKKVITYILESESGISLRASGFSLEDECCGGRNWTGARKRKNNTVPEEMKQRWVKYLAA